jgi:hypothetical protein
MNGRKPARSRLIRSFQVMASRSSFGKRRPQMRLQLAADGDVENEQSRHQQARKHAGKPQLADRLPRDHAVKHQHHRWRNQDSQLEPPWITPVIITLS